MRHLPALSSLLSSLLALSLAVSRPADAGGVRFEIGPGTPFLTLGAALQAAFSADTIVLRPGTYNECVTVTGLVLLTIVGKRGAVLDATGCGTAITVADGDHVTLKSLAITGATTQGILVQAAATNTVIAKTTIQDPAVDPALSVLQTGINVAGAADTTIDGVTVRGATSEGILVTSASGATVKKSKIMDGIGAGIRLDLTLGANVQKNVLQNLRAPAIWLLHEGGQGANGGGAHSFVLSNKIVSSPGGGITVAGIDNTIAKNKIDPVAAPGIEALPTDLESTYSGNTVVAPTGAAGIVAGGTSGIFEKNTVKHPAQDGFVVNGAQNTITGCKVTQAVGTAFVVGPDATNNDFLGCAATKAGADGFAVQGTANTFTKCKASGSGGLDLDDPAGGATTNLYTACKFKTSNLP